MPHARRQRRILLALLGLAAVLGLGLGRFTSTSRKKESVGVPALRRATHILRDQSVQHVYLYDGEIALARCWLPYRYEGASSSSFDETYLANNLTGVQCTVSHKPVVTTESQAATSRWARRAKWASWFPWMAESLGPPPAKEIVVFETIVFQFDDLPEDLKDIPDFEVVLDRLMASPIDRETSESLRDPPRRRRLILQSTK